MLARPVCRSVVSIAIAALLATLCGRVGAGEFVLVQDGQFAATIVISATPTHVTTFAAQELLQHVHKITGAWLPVKLDNEKVDGARVLVGPSKATSELGVDAATFQPQEYMIRFVGNTLILLGHDSANRENILENWWTPAGGNIIPPGLFMEQGTSYAAHDFLERFCDVRWFGPRDFGMVLPKTKTLAFQPKDIRRAPAMTFRVPGEPAGMLSELWQQPSNWDRAWLWARLRLGGEAYTCNHSFYGFYDRFWEKNPKNPQAFVASHPDWFAQGYDLNAKENAWLQGRPPQMCYSSQGFIDQVVADARNYFDGKGLEPGAIAAGDCFALAPMDNNWWCKCPACQAQLTVERGKGNFSNGAASDYLFGFVNKVASELAKSHPHKRLAAQSYSDYAYYPLHVQLEPNVSVHTCLHVRNWWAPKMKENDLRIYRDWADREKGRPLYLWLYYCFPEEVATGGGFHCFPGFSAHTLDQQFKMFARDGVRGPFLNALGEQIDFYLTAKLMDDPSLDVDALLDDFVTHYYGTAASPIKRFYLCVEDIYSNTANYPEDVRNGSSQTHQTEEIAWKYLGTAPRMAVLGRLMDKATRLADASSTGLEKERVALFRKTIWDYMVDGRKQYLVKQPKKR